MSPKSSHSSSSMNPDQALEHRAWRTHLCGPRRVSGLTLQLWGLMRASHLLGPRSRQELAAEITNFRARCPSLRREAGCGLRLFWLPHHPLSSPPPRGLELRAKPLNPGAPGVS